MMHNKTQSMSNKEHSPNKSIHDKCIPNRQTPHKDSTDILGTTYRSNNIFNMRDNINMSFMVHNVKNGRNTTYIGI